MLRSNETSPHRSTSWWRQSGRLLLKGRAIGRHQWYPLAQMVSVSLSALQTLTGHSGSPRLVLSTNLHNRQISELLPGICGQHIPLTWSQPSVAPYDVVTRKTRNMK